MARRQIEGPDGYVMAVLQGGQAKAALHGKFGEAWLPVQVDEQGRLVLNVGSVTANIGVVDQGAAGTTPWPVTLNGSFDTFRAPVTGVRTVTATAAEIFAGASRLAGRRKMILKNEDLALRFRIGSASVTQQNGFPIEPGAVVELSFDPSVDVPVYAISEGASLQVAVMEL